MRYEKKIGRFSGSTFVLWWISTEENKYENKFYLEKESEEYEAILDIKRPEVEVLSNFLLFKGKKIYPNKQKIFSIFLILDLYNLCFCCIHCFQVN